MYTHRMIRTQIYLPEEMHSKLNRLATVRNEPMAHIVRTFVEEGLQREQPSLRSNVHILVEITNLAKEHHWQGPGDAAERHNAYFQSIWDIEEQAKQLL